MEVENILEKVNDWSSYNDKEYKKRNKSKELIKK